MVYNYIMGKITDISQQKRNKSRVNIFIDDEFVCGMDAVTAAAARLKIGKEISQSELVAAVRDSEINSAFERAVGYLSLSPRSRREIEKYLTDKSYSREVAQAAIERLELYHYIDDRLYAESFVKSKSKKYGEFRLKSELKKRGIAQEIIDDLLDDGAGNDGATEVARKYLRSHRSADKQKLKRFLAGRGFGWDAISSVVGLLADEGAFDGDDEDY